MDAHPAERRSAARYEVHAHVDLEQEGGQGVPQTVRNISVGGICIHSENVQDVGTVVDLKITFPELDGAQLEVRGTVVWVSRHPPAEMGIRFLDLDEARRETLRRYLDRAVAPR